MDIMTYAMAKSYTDKSVKDVSTGTDRGVYASKAALLAVNWQTTDKTAANYVKNKDYATVLADESQSGECWHYTYNLEEGGQNNGWQPEYRINEVPVAPYNSAPAMDGTANAGSSANYARGDHVHPSNIVELTAEQYAALVEAGTVNPNVTYIVTDEQGANASVYTQAQIQTLFAALLQNVSGAYVPYRGAGAHNSIYRGMQLPGDANGAPTAAQYDAIDAGTFDGLYIGDYWTINGINWRVAALDYWLHYGDTECTKHHVVVVPDTCIVTSVKMNSTNIVTGAYVGSDYYTGANGNTGREGAGNIIKAAFGNDHILAHRIILQNAVPEGKGYTGVWGGWYDAHPADLMSEEMVYGCKEFKNEVAGENLAGNHTVDHGQLPLFRHDHSRICNRASWWLREVADQVSFSIVYSNGQCDCRFASYSIGVRPASAICKANQS